MSRDVSVRASGRVVWRLITAGGINPGMKSVYPSPAEVLDDLGDKVVLGFAVMTARTRDDLRVYRSTFPGWSAAATDRGLLAFAHDRAWAHVVEIFDDAPNIFFVDKPPTREVFVGTRYRLRIKKHDIDGRVSTYPTPGALAFMDQGQLTFDGLEEVRLVAGYRWDPELREIGAPVISLRDGYTNIIWTHELDEPADPGIVSVTPILPTMSPQLPVVEFESDDGAEGVDEP